MVAKRARIPRRVGYALVALLAAVAVLELVAGVVIGDRDVSVRMFPARDNELFRADPLLFWTLRPGAVRPSEDIRINAHGYRGASIEPKRDDVARVVCLGDSVTFGFKVKERESYPALLQERLSAGHRVEVLNVGVPGYSSLQGRRQFARDIVALGPDLVIVSLGNNDLLDGSLLDSRQPVYSASVFAWRQRVLRLNLTRALTQLRRPTQTQPNLSRCTAEETRDNLTAIARTAARHGVKAVFFHPLHAREADLKLPIVTVPDPLPTIDVAGAFAEARPWGRPLFQLDDNHPTPPGYRVMTERIAEFLRAGDFLAGFER